MGLLGNLRRWSDELIVTMLDGFEVVQKLDRIELRGPADHPHVVR